MTKVTMYGKHSSTYEYLKMMLLKNVKKSGLSVDISEVSDIDEFIRLNIDHIPAVKINDTMVKKSNNINAYIQNINHLILKEEGYGNLRKLIVATDFSETSDNAINYAYRLSKHLRSVIKLVHVYLPHSKPLLSPGTSEYMIENTARRQLNELRESIIDPNLSSPQNENFIESVFLYGLPDDELISYSNIEDKSIIVMGSSGRSGNLRTILGSVSTSVASNSVKPVIVVPPFAKFQEINKIAYCSDNPAVDIEALDALSDILSAFNSKLHIIHIQEDDKAYDDELITQWQKARPSVKMSYTLVKSDNKIEAVNNYCKEHEINLLSLTKQKNGFFKNLFHKSFTKRMLINTEIPLFIMNQK